MIPKKKPQNIGMGWCNICKAPINIIFKDAKLFCEKCDSQDLDMKSCIICGKLMVQENEFTYKTNCGHLKNARLEKV